MNFDLISRKRNNPTTSQLILLLICWFIPKLPGNFSNFFLLFLLNRYCNPQRPLDDSSVLLSLLSTHSPPRKAVVEWCEANNFALQDLRGLLCPCPSHPQFVLCCQHQRRCDFCWRK